MLSHKLLTKILDRVVKELNMRYSGDVFIDKLIERKSKFEVYMVITGRRVKIILDKRNVKVRVYSGLTGLDISLRRMFIREYNKILRMKKYGEKPL